MDVCGIGFRGVPLDHDPTWLSHLLDPFLPFSFTSCEDGELVLLECNHLEFMLFQKFLEYDAIWETRPLHDEGMAANSEFTAAPDFFGVWNQGESLAIWVSPEKVVYLKNCFLWCFCVFHGTSQCNYVQTSVIMYKPV